MARKQYQTKSPPPYLRRISLLPEKRGTGYPFDLPWLRDDFELEFSAPITIIVGENGTGKSTLIEALAALAGYDEAGGGKGYRLVDHSDAMDHSGADLADALRAGWLPKVTHGWFFKAESLFAVAREMDRLAQTYGGAAPDWLSHSHGEGFLRVIEERMTQQGFYLMDEPESALSPRRQLALLRLLDRIQQDARAQVIMATHSPILMALPGADVWQVTKAGFAPVDDRDTRHFRLYQDFTVDPEAFVAAALADRDESQF